MNRQITFLTAAVAVVGANSMVLSPITAAVARDLGGDPAGIVQAAAAFGVTTALSALFLAPRADVVGPDRALRTAVVILALSLCGSMLAPSKGALILAQGVGGIGGGMALPAIYTLAALMAPKGQEKRAIGVVLSGWVVALTAGVAGSGFVAEYLGWRTVYGILFTLMAGLALIMGRIDMRSVRLATAPTSPLTALRVPGIGGGLFSAFALMLGFYGTYAFLGAHVADRLGRGTDGAGWVTLAYGVGFGVSVLLDPVLDRMPPRRAGTLAFAGLAATYVGMATTSAGYVPMLMLAFAWGITQHAALNVVVSRLTALEPRQRGAIMGLNSAVTYAGVTGGALAFRLPWEAGGLVACAAVSALCALAGAVEAARRPRAARAQNSS